MTTVPVRIVGKPGERRRVDVDGRQLPNVEAVHVSEEVGEQQRVTVSLVGTDAEFVDESDEQ